MSKPIEVWPRPGRMIHAVTVWDRQEDREVEVIRGVQRSGGHVFPLQTGPVVKIVGERGRLVRTEDGRLWRLVGGAHPRWRAVTRERSASASQR